MAITLQRRTIAPTASSGVTLKKRTITQEPETTPKFTDKPTNIFSRFKEHPFLSTLTPYGITGIQDFGEITRKAPDIAVNVLPPFLPPVEPFKKAETEFRKELLAAPANIALSPINYIIPAVSRVAKFNLLKGGIKETGEKLSKAGYGVGKVTIPQEAIKQTAKGTSLPEVAAFRVKAKTLKVKPKFQIGETVPTEKGIQAILPKVTPKPTTTLPITPIITKESKFTNIAGKISTKLFTEPIEATRKLVEPVKYMVKNPVAKSLAQDIEDIQLKGSRYAGEALTITNGFSDIRNANEALAVSNLIEGKPTNINPKELSRLQSATQKIREASNLIAERAQKANVKIQIVNEEGKIEWVPFRPVKNYVPRVINKDIAESLQGGMKDLYAKISELKNAGVRDNIKQAILKTKEKGNLYVVRLFEWLQSKNMHATPSTLVRLANVILNKEYIGSYGHLERPRIAEALPPEFYERRANLVFLEYFERASKRIAEIEQWGQTNKLLTQKKRSLAKQDYEESKLIKDLYTRYSEKIRGGIGDELANLVSITKIGLGSSEIENLTQLLVSTMPKVGLINSFKGIAKAIFYRPTKVSISKTGLPFDNIIKEILGYAHHTTLGKVNDFLLNVKGFVGINRANALFTAGMIESYIKDTLLPATKSHLPLLGKLRSQWAYDNLAKLNIQPKDVINGKISEGKLIEGMLKGAREYQLFSNITNEPLWLSNPKYRALTVLKRFGIKQPMMVFHRIIYDELKFANPIPLIRFLVLGALGGAFVTWAKRKLWEIGTGLAEKITKTYAEEPKWITKWDDQDRSTFENILDLLAQAGAVGMMQQLFEKPENIDFLIKPVIAGEAQRAFRIGKTLFKTTEQRGRRITPIPWEKRRAKATRQALQAFPLSKYFLGKE